ncbi:MAG: ACP S-malonyltransferase [Planctomycetes bacterium]|nr:ACP S-malonyltransferase [Planctomycetota bacterium]
MPTLLIDTNIDGHGDLISMRLDTDAWRAFRDHLHLKLIHFEAVGLDRKAKDDVVWRYCQAKGLYLLTDNRNLESDDSLEATIRREGTVQSLPVFTISDADRIYHSAAYLEDVVETLLEFLLDEANYRGAGRLFLP